MIETIAAVTLSAAAGSAAAADTPAIGLPVSDAPRALTGHLYYNAATGASVFTPAKEYLANRARSPLRALYDDINGDHYPDLWVNTNTDPCPIGTPTDPYIQVGVLDGISEVTAGNFHTGNHHLYKCQLPPGETDVLVETVMFTYWTDLDDTDTNSDALPDANTNGAGIELSFWDREDPYGSGSSICSNGGGPGMYRVRLATFNVTDLPGTLTPGQLAGVVVTLDLGPSDIFEIADTDGIGPPNGNYNPFVAVVDTDTDFDTIPDTRSADWDGNGTIDWAVSFQGIQPTDGRQATIAYTLAAPGRFGTAGEFATDGVTPLNAQAGVAGDGLIDIVRQTDVQFATFDLTRVKLDSVEAPMGLGFPFTSFMLGSAPEQLTFLSRFSVFYASLGEQPDPAGPPPISPLYCAGYPYSDYFGWSVPASSGNGWRSGSLNCGYDVDGDGIEETSMWSGAFLGLAGIRHPIECADCDMNQVVNIDDIDCFVNAFLTGDLYLADCDGSGSLNIDDIDCFVAIFLVGCP